MAKPRKEVIGETFGYLTVIADAPYKNRTRQALVMCHCGTQLTVRVSNLVSGNTTSCGCFWRSRITSHGKSQTRLYKIWQGMVERCTNPSHVAYSRYGGAGITITPQWLDVSKFIEWAESSDYKDDLTLDRIDNALGYFPDNCRWVDRIAQQRNRGAHSNSSSRYVGVGYYKATGKWKAWVKVNKRPIHIGYFSTELDAAKARDSYIIEHKLQNFTLNGVL